MMMSIGTPPLPRPPPLPSHHAPPPQAAQQIANFTDWPTFRILQVEHHMLPVGYDDALNP